MSFSFVYITSPDKKISHHMAQTLVGEKLAACVNILGNIESIYRWNKKVEQGKEVSFLVKTKTSLVKRVIKRVKEMHPYECPCVVSWKMSDGNPDFLKWIKNETI